MSPVATTKAQRLEMRTWIDRTLRQTEPERARLLLSMVEDLGSAVWLRAIPANPDDQQTTGAHSLAGTPPDRV